MASGAHLYMALFDVDDSGAERGKIPGEVMAQSYLGQIEITEWNWELKLRTADELSKGDPHLLTEPAEFHFSKPMDLATPLMLDRLRTKAMLKAVVTVTEDADQLFKLVATLGKARLVRYDLDASDGEKSTEVKEKWKMNYDTITLEHVPDRRPGQTALKTVSTQHKRSANAKSTANSPAATVIQKYGDLKPLEKRKEAFEGIEALNKKQPLK